MRTMKNIISLFTLAFIVIPFSFATGELNTDKKSQDIRFIKNNKRIPNIALQEKLRAEESWANFVGRHATWQVVFNEENRKPHRAYGKGISTFGSSPEERALNFIVNELSGFDVPVSELVLSNASTSRKHHHINFYQEHEGLKVAFSRLTVKMTLDNKVIMFGVDVYDDISISIIPELSIATAENLAGKGLGGSISLSKAEAALLILPIPGNNKNNYKLVYEVMVSGFGEDKIPFRYRTLLDAVDGKVLYRQNEVVTHAPKANLEVDVDGTVYPTHSYNPSEVKPLPNLKLRINNTNYFTDSLGHLTTGITSSTTGFVYLEGTWSTVKTNNVTPTFTTAFAAGPNSISFDSDANIRERTAYYHVNIVHDYLKSKIPTFTGMDFSLETNVDDNSNTCNAFYDGFSINFYAPGGGCLSYATVGDVVYHEYAHGINDNFYQDQGGSFQNGAMGEGYADVWGLAITENPILGVGGNDSDPNDFIRRYDINPKIYPDDIVGEVHGDGEIIAGAWWDLYLNFGSDMDATMALFTEAYYGLQAQTSNGNEGQAFKDVLLDVLEADDDDGNISNGTPNIADICDAFGKHGITLISNASLTHTDITVASAGQDITIDVTLNLGVTTYLGDVKLFYRLQGDTAWIELVMSNVGGSNYQKAIPAQVKGVIVEYYIGVVDNICGVLAAVQPIGANAENPTLPYYVLVDYLKEAVEDFDFNNFSGGWSFGVPGDDATTGMWAYEQPEGMFDNSYELAPTTQFTSGGFQCAVTEKNVDKNSGDVGLNDVDGGVTTLLSPALDLSGYYNPVITYRRWFSNASPSSANPGNDPWYVEITDDGNIWVPVEFTYVGDNNWRRFVFNVEDYVSLSNNVQIKFIASDSTHLGQNLDGGSLVEAAVDDIEIWSQVPEPITFSIISNACNGDCEGEITATPDTGVAPYTYLWNDSLAQTNATATGLCAGTYTVIVVDGLGDTITSVAAVTEPAVLAVTCGGISPSCNSCTDGSTIATVTGGTGPYTYLWDDAAAQTTAIATGLGSGTYNLVVTDANGCTVSASPISISVGVEESIKGESINIFPNPVKNDLFVSFTLLQQDHLAVVLRNYLGEVVYSDDLGERGAGDMDISIPAAGLSAGIYTLELQVGSQVYPKKVTLVK